MGIGRVDVAEPKTMCELSAAAPKVTIQNPVYSMRPHAQDEMTSIASQQEIHMPNESSQSTSAPTRRALRKWTTDEEIQVIAVACGSKLITCSCNASEMKARRRKKGDPVEAYCTVCKRSWPSMAFSKPLQLNWRTIQRAIPNGKSLLLPAKQFHRAPLKPGLQRNLQKTGSPICLMDGRTNSSLIEKMEARHEPPDDPGHRVLAIGKTEPWSCAGILKCIPNRNDAATMLIFSTIARVYVAYMQMGDGKPSLKTTSTDFTIVPFFSSTNTLRFFVDPSNPRYFPGMLVFASLFFRATS